MIFRTVFFTLLVALSVAPGALGDDIERDGVLPLRDGVLPLRLNGSATQGANRLATQVNLTTANQNPLAGSQANALVCQITGVNLSKHAATGTVLVGLAQYTIKGICYNHDTAEMEVVAERPGLSDRSFMAGPLTSPEPRAFAGRLTITGSSPPAGRYQFAVRSEQEILVPTDR